tara:strand:+ start:382 stop:525 length:144 start_codon:yes stop_codon:yes gene_type:complete
MALRLAGELKVIHPIPFPTSTSILGVDDSTEILDTMIFLNLRLLLIA